MLRTIPIAGIVLSIVAAAVVAILAANLSFPPGTFSTDSSKLSLLILIVQALITLFGILAASLAAESVWAQFSVAAASPTGLPLCAFDHAAREIFPTLATYSLGTLGSLAAFGQIILSLLFTTWLGAAIIPRVSNVHWYDVPQSSASLTSIGDIATSLETGDCYIPADMSGLNLQSCTDNWMLGTVASLFLGELAVSGNIYASGCNPAYMSSTGAGGCAQSVISGLSPLQIILKGYPFATITADLPTYQINLDCTLNQVDLNGPNVARPKQELIWVTTGSDNSSFTLNMFGLNALSIPHSFVGQCTLSITSGTLSWTLDPSTRAIASGSESSMNGNTSPSILLSQFVSLINFANSSQIGYSWAPLLGDLMGGHDDGDTAPLGQIFNGILAGLLNRAYVDSVLHPTQDSTSGISVFRPRVHFATGVVRWLCIAGGVVVLLCASGLMVIWRIGEKSARGAGVIDMGRPSTWLLARTIRLDDVQQVPVSGDVMGRGEYTGRLVLKWREHDPSRHATDGIHNASQKENEANKVAVVLVDEKGKLDEWPRLKKGVRYIAAPMREGNVGVGDTHQLIYTNDD